MLNIFKRWQTVSKKRECESGNVFAALFGAVVIIGAVGAGSVSLLKGPVSGMVSLNKQNITEMRMEIASKLIMADALDRFATLKATDGDTDTTEYIELSEYAAGTITGGGTIPATLNINDIDPWSSQFGYCTWDNGDDTNDAKNDAGTGADNRLDGQNAATSEFIALVSPGPNRTFETGCYAYGDAGNDGLIKPSGSDDIIVTYTYQNAVQTMGDLWEFSADTDGTSAVLEIDENLDFRSDVAITGLLSFNASAAGLVLSTSPGATCTGPQEAQIFLDTSTTPDSLVICNAGTIEPVVEGGGGSVSGDSGLVAHYELDETSGTSVSDSAGVTSGTFSGEAAVVSVTGQINTALSFDGSDDIITIPNDASLENFTELTLSAWIYPTDNGQSSGSRIISKADGGTGDNYALTLINSNQLEFRIEVNGDDQEDLNSNVVSINNWYHVVGTWDGTDMRLYINGAEDINSPLAHAGTLDADGNPLIIGSHSGSPGSRRFDGHIDDARVYNRALSATEVAALYFSNVDIVTTINPNKLSTTMYYWNLDTGFTPTVAPDHGIDFIQVEGGASSTTEHACGLKADSSVWCWGTGNSRKQLGVSSTSTDLTLENANQIPGLPSDIIEISAGFGVSYALSSSGTAYCWGSRDSCGWTAIGSDSSIPIPVRDVTNFVDIESGDRTSNHSCGLTSDNTIWCWGLNAEGQLGDGTTTDSRPPVQVSNITDFVALAVANESSCGIRKNGEAWCWGLNDQGQLGNGTTVNSLVPVKVETDSRFKKIKMSQQGTACGLSTDNEILCWGDGRNQALGDGSTDDHLNPVLVDDTEQGYIDIINKMYGGFCGLKSDGRVFCWGRGSAAMAQSPGNNSTPTLITGVSNFIDVFASGDTSWGLALNSADGPETAPTSAYVINQEQDSGDTIGSYGLSTTLNSANATDNIGIGFAIDATTVTSGDTLSAGIDTNETELTFKTQNLAGASLIRRASIDQEGGLGVHSNGGFTNDSIVSIRRSDTRNWNSDYYYGLLIAGDEAATDQGSFFGMDELSGAAMILFTKDFIIAGTNNDGSSITNLLELDVSNNEAVISGDVLQTSSSSSSMTSNVYSNTANDSAQLSFERYGNTASTAIPNDTKLGEIKFKAHDGTSIDADGVASIRAESDGAVGAGSVPTKLTISTDPTGNPSDNDLIIDSDGDVGINVSSADSPLHVGGRGAANQGVMIGNDTTCSGSDEGTLRYTTGNDVEYCDGSAWQPFSGAGGGSAPASCEHGQYFNYVAVGTGSVCGVYSNGRMACWGDGRSTGELMLGESLPGFLVVPTVIGENLLDNIKKHVSGHQFSCALNHVGEVFCSGYNDEGQLGAGFTDGSNIERLLPYRVLLPGKAKDLFSGRDHACAIMDNSQVACWGSGNDGRLGNNSTADQNIPVFVHNLTGVVNMYLGRNSSCAILKDRTLKCWGDSGEGKLGNGITSGDFDTPQDIALTDVIHGIQGGTGTTLSFACALKADGTVWCTGDNSEQQLGNGAGSDESTYQQVTGLSNIVDIATANNGVLALRNDGAILSWGTDSEGALGQNTTGSVVSSPTQIPNVTAVALANGNRDNSSCFISTDRNTYCMGDNSSGELGNDDRPNHTEIPQKVLNPLACDAEKIVFVTSTTHEGNLGGIEGADKICQARADSANLPGTYYAWLSDGETYPENRYNQGIGGYVLTDGTVIANDWEDLVDGTIDNNIDVDENGNTVAASSVWSGVGVDGINAAYNPGTDCTMWQSNDNGGVNGNGQIGATNTTGSGWTDTNSLWCNTPNVRLFCFQQ